ncbi:MAG: hypothetical protein ACYC09_10435 [Bacteroidota bacterium]
MATVTTNLTSELRSVVRNVLFIAVAIILFLMKRHYAGPFQDLVQSYAGNMTVSFALYFVFLRLCLKSPRFGRLITTAVVLACVESFEIFDGFGFMANTYDPFDLLANAVGAGSALGVDLLLNKNRSRHLDNNLA